MTLRETIAELKMRLPDYLREKNIKNPKRFRCINGFNHRNQDRNPSCGLVPESGNTKAHCFVCDRSFDIFDFAHHFEGLPLSGKEFLTVTVATLAKKYGIPFELNESDEELSKRISYMRAYRDAMLIANEMKKQAKDVWLYLTKERGFEENTLKAYNVGAVISWDEFITQMAAIGWKRDYLESIGITESIFKAGHAIFPIRDVDGNVVGFAARDVYWRKGQGPKYVNTTTTEYFRKGEILYGLDKIARRNARTVFLVEGYFDVLRLAQSGINDACAIGGTALSEAHLRRLAEAGVSEARICLDGDDAGRNAISRSDDKSILALAAKTPIALRVTYDGEDHDSFVNPTAAMA